MSWTDGPLMAIDTETTGKDPRTARIVTVALVTIKPGDRVCPAEWLVSVDESIPAEATAIHGITTKHARENGHPLADVLRVLMVELLSAWRPECPLVIFNAPYDLTVLACELARVGLPPFTVSADERSVIDPLCIDRDVDRYRKGSRRLEDACRHYRVAHDGAHNATNDAIAAARLAWRLGTVYADVGEMDLSSLHKKQEMWYADWAENYQDYLRRNGDPTAVIDRQWPIRMAGEGEES